MLCEQGHGFQSVARLRRRLKSEKRMLLSAIIVFVYGMLVLVGGVFGFVKAKSRPSLIAGVAGDFALSIAGVGIISHQSWAVPLALVLIAALMVFFAARYARTRLFMPGGLMSILSLLALLGVWLTRGY